MKGWMIVGLSAACIGVSIYLATVQPDAPAHHSAPKAAKQAVASEGTTPPAPIVMSNVVEVTDLDPLLDPPAKPMTGVPFDSSPAAAPVSVPAAPPIPPAVD